MIQDKTTPVDILLERSGSLSLKIRCILLSRFRSRIMQQVQIYNAHRLSLFCFGGVTPYQITCPWCVGAKVCRGGLCNLLDVVVEVAWMMENIMMSRRGSEVYGPPPPHAP